MVEEKVLDEKVTPASRHGGKGICGDGAHQCAVLDGSGDLAAYEPGRVKVDVWG